MIFLVSLSNLENVLQRNLRGDRAWECIIRASEGTNFENFLLHTKHDDVDLWLLVSILDFLKDFVRSSSAVLVVLGR